VADRDERLRSAAGFLAVLAGICAVATPFLAGTGDWRTGPPIGLLAMFAGTLLVYLPALHAMRAMSGERPQWWRPNGISHRAFWSIFRTFPPAAKVLAGATWLYAALAAVAFVLTSLQGGDPMGPFRHAVVAALTFTYAISLAALYTFWSHGTRRLRRCANRHTIPDGRETCPQCGLRPEGANR
jgi:hypothetical protein